MNKLFEKLNQFSYPTVLFIASGLTLVAILPLWIYISTQQTHLEIKAVKTLPLVPTTKPSPAVGPVPVSPPALTRVYPWVGKPGDVIIIEGKNFGQYPKNRRLSRGGEVVSDASVSTWQDSRIEALIPPNPQQGGTAAIRIDTYPIAESVPLAFYDETAKVRLRKQGTVISASGVSGVVRATLITQNGKPFGSPSTSSEFAQGKREITVSAQKNGQTTLFTLAPSEEILTLLLTDEKGTYIPYSINPAEFGF
jgi:hypothetical protein